MVLGVAYEHGLPQLLLQQAGPKLIALQIHGEGIVLHAHIGLVQVELAQVHVLHVGVGGFAVQEHVDDDVVVIAGDGAVQQLQLIEAFLLHGEVPGDGAAGPVPQQRGVHAGEVGDVGTGALLGGIVRRLDPDLRIRLGPKAAAAVQIGVVIPQVQIALRERQGRRIRARGTGGRGAERRQNGGAEQSGQHSFQFHRQLTSGKG